MPRRGNGQVRGYQGGVAKRGPAREVARAGSGKGAWQGLLTALITLITAVLTVLISITSPRVLYTHVVITAELTLRTLTIYRSYMCAVSRVLSRVNIHYQIYMVLYCRLGQSVNCMIQCCFNWWYVVAMLSIALLPDWITSYTIMQFIVHSWMIVRCCRIRIIFTKSPCCFNVGVQITQISIAPTQQNTSEPTTKRKGKGEKHTLVYCLN